MTSVVTTCTKLSNFPRDRLRHLLGGFNAVGLDKQAVFTVFKWPGLDDLFLNLHSFSIGNVKTGRNFLAMEWYKENAIKAYLETIKLCKVDHERRCCSFWNPGLHNSELIAALAAGTNSQLIIEICNSMTCTTIALAAASRQTGGRFVCVLSRPDSLPESLERMGAVDLLGDVEFLVGEAKDLISSYSSIDFALVDCSNEKFVGLFKMLNLNPKGAILSTNNLFKKINYERGGCIWQTQHIGESLQVTRIKRDSVTSRRVKKRWIVQIDSQTGEEHVFQISRNRSQTR